MLRRIVSYLVSLAIALHPIPLYATNPDITVLQARSAYRAETDKGPVDCIDVKRSKSGEIMLAFDPSLHKENSNIYLVLDQKPVGLVTYLQEKLSFIGWGKNTFKLESPATYTYPLFYAQVEGRLVVDGGDYSKSGAFIADDLSTRGEFKSRAELALMSKGKMELFGRFKLAQLNVLAAALQINAIAEAIDIYLDAKKIGEDETNRFYASNNLVVKGYKEGFNHRGLLKAKNAIHFQGGSYTSANTAQTLAGVLFQDDSESTTETGRVVAGVYDGKGGDLTYMPTANFLGYYFFPQIDGKLTMNPGSQVMVQEAAPVWAQGNIALRGNLDKISLSKINFPYTEFFGLDKLKLASVQEGRLKAGEIQKLQEPIFNKINVSGIYLQSAKDVVMGKNGTLRSPDANVVLEGVKVNSRGQIEGGYFEDLSTVIKAHSARLSGFITFHNISALVDDVIKLNGQIQGKLTIIFKKAERKKKAAEALEAQKKAEAAAKLAAEEAERVRVQKEAEAKAAAKADGERKQKEAEAARLAKEQALKEQAKAQKRLKAAEAEAKAAEAAKYRKTVEVAEKANLVGDVTISKADKADLKGGVLKKGDVAIDAKTLVQAPKNLIDANKVQLTGDKHTMGGEVKAVEHVQQTTKSIDIQETAKINAKKEAHSRTKNMTVAGQLKCEGEATTVVDNLKTTEKGKIIAKPNYVEAKKGDHAGEISGDKAHVKIDTLNETATGKVKAKQEAVVEVKKGQLNGDNHAAKMHVKGDDVTQGGSVTGDEVTGEIKKYNQKKGAKFVGTKQTALNVKEKGQLDGTTGDAKSPDSDTTIVGDGKITTGVGSHQQAFKDVFMKATELDHSGDAQGKTAGVEGKKVKIRKPGKVHGKEAAQVIAKTEYENDGAITSKGTVYAEVPNADDLGYIKAEKGLTAQSEVQPDVAGILAGQHKNLKDNSSVHLIVPKPVTIEKAPTAPFSFGITAPSITTKVDLVSPKKDMTFVASKGNLNLKDVSGRHVHTEATGKVDVGKVTFTYGAYLKAGQAFTFKDDFTGRGRADVIAPTIANPLVYRTPAAPIKGRFARSWLQQAVPTQLRVVSDGLYMDAYAGDLTNRGIMQGRGILYRHAAGNVTDEGTWIPGSVPRYIPAQAIGGRGVSMKLGDETYNLGLVSIAGKKVRNIASHVSTAQGADAFIDGRYGIENISQAQSYLVDSWTKKGIFGKRKHYEEWSNVFGEAKENIGGKTIRASEKGGFYNSGSLHAGQGADNTSVHGPITHAALVLTNVVHISKKKFSGAVRSSMHQDTQQAVVVRFLNNEGIYHSSRTAGIRGQGTFFMAPIVVLKAPKRIHFDEVLLNHSIRTKSSALGPTISSIPIFGNNGINALPGVSLYNDLRGMGQSDADVGRLVAGLTQTWSQITGLGNAYNNGQLGQQVLAQFGEIGFSFSSSKSVQKSQTAAPASFHVGQVHFISDESVDLLGGAQVNASELAKFVTPELILGASRLESSSKTKSLNFGGGFNPYTWSGSVNFGMNKSNSHGVQYQYAQVNAPVVDLGVMDHLGLYGGAINCNKIHGKAKLVDVVTLQDEFHSKHSGFNVNLSSNFANGFSNPTGGFNFNFGASQMKQAYQHSGIFAAHGVDDSFKIGQLNVTDTYLGPLLAAQASQVNFTKIYDVNKSYSFGLGMQGLDFSNGEAFAHSFGKNAAVLAAGAAAAELGKTVGLNDQLASALAMAAAAGVSNEINEYLGKKGSAPASGIGILGNLNYSFGDHQVNVTGVDFSWSNLKQAAGELGLAVDKLLAPDAVQAPVVPVYVQEPIAEEPAVEAQEEIVEYNDRPALRMKTDEDKDNVEGEPKEEKKKPADKKKVTSDIGREKDANVDLQPSLQYFSLPAALRNLIENAPLILDEYAEPSSATDRVEERAKKNSPELYAMKEKQDRNSELNQGGLDKANAILMDPNSSWGDWLWANMAKVGCQENLNGSSGASAQGALIIYGTEARNSGLSLLQEAYDTGSINAELLDDFALAGGHLVLAVFQIGGGKAIKAVGKKFITGTQTAFRKIFDIRKQNSGQAIIGFVDNPKAGIWSTARYSADLQLYDDPRYDAVKQKWVQDPKAPLNVFTHGNENVVLVRTPDGIKPVNAKGFSKILMNLNEYTPGTTLHLFACNTGKKDNGFAQQLANRINAPVFAPTDYMITLKSGRIAIGGLKTVNGLHVLDHTKLGESRLFMPKRGRPINDDLKASVGKSKFLSIAQNLLIDDKGSGKSPFKGDGLSKRALKTLTKMKHNPANDWTVDDLATVGQSFGIEVKKGGNHILLKYPDGTQFGLPYSRMTVDKRMVKKFTRKIDDLYTPGAGSGFLMDDSGSINIPTKREIKLFGQAVKNSVFDRIHGYQYKKHGWVPLVDKPRDGKWDEVTTDTFVFMNELDGSVQNLKHKQNPRPFTLVWEGANYMPFEDEHPWSTAPQHFQKYLYAKGYKHGQPIALVSCHSERIARELSTLMNVPVSGFHGNVRPMKAGGFKLIDLDTRRLGYMDTYYPLPSYKKALVGAAGMAAGIASLLLLRTDTRNEEADNSRMDSQQILYEGWYEKNQPF